MKTIEMQTESGGQVLIEVSDPVGPPLKRKRPAGRGSAAGGADSQINKLEDVGEKIADVCKTLHKKVHSALEGTAPNELTLEFGVKLAGEVGVPLVTKGSAEATFKVTLKWNFKSK